MNVILIYIQGFLSVFSPCVLSALPILVSYFNQNKRYLDIFYFMLGILTTFMSLCISISMFFQLFSKYQAYLQVISGILLILFGGFTLFLKSKQCYALNQFKIFDKAHGAFLIGVLFSFSWTPCIGPLLASVLWQISKSQNILINLMMIVSYSLGFLTVLGVMAFFLAHVQYLLSKIQNTIHKLLSILIIGMGINVLIMGVNNVKQQIAFQQKTALVDKMRYDFSLSSNLSHSIQLSDYMGKRVVVTFFGTWCENCGAFLKKLQSFQEKFSDVTFLLVASPNDGKEGDIATIEKYLKINNISLPVLYDTDQKIKFQYRVQVVPMTFVFLEDDTLKGYIPGNIPNEYLEEIFFE